MAQTKLTYIAAPLVTCATLEVYLKGNSGDSGQLSLPAFHLPKWAIRSAMTDYTQDFEESRKAENRLKRISAENEKDQESIVQKWLDIADRAFKDDKDNDRTPQAA